MTVKANLGLYKTGQEAPYNGNYDFVRYTDDIPAKAPTLEERRIYLKRGENFPPIRSTNKGAWWKHSN